MRFFIDECISPSLARYLNEDGLHDAVHPRDRGRLGEPDHVVFARAVTEDRIIITENAEDFYRLAARVDLHPRLDHPAIGSAAGGLAPDGPRGRLSLAAWRRASGKPPGQFGADHLSRR